MCSLYALLSCKKKHQVARKCSDAAQCWTTKPWSFGSHPSGIHPSMFLACGIENWHACLMYRAHVYFIGFVAIGIHTDTWRCISSYGWVWLPSPMHPCTSIRDTCVYAPEQTDINILKITIISTLVHCAITRMGWVGDTRQRTLLSRENKPLLSLTVCVLQADIMLLKRHSTWIKICAVLKPAMYYLSAHCGVRLQCCVWCQVAHVRGLYRDNLAKRGLVANEIINILYCSLYTAALSTRLGAPTWGLFPRGGAEIPLEWNFISLFVI